jgi:hypothetical protein
MSPKDREAEDKRAHPETDEHRAGCTHCQYVYDSKLPDAPTGFCTQPWGEGRSAYILTHEQAELIADSLEFAISAVNHGPTEHARALAVQFRASVTEGGKL